VTRTDWLTSRHSFAFGSHYDPANTHCGVLMANNEDTLRAGSGFEPHPHRELEIVTWVLDGVLAHEDSVGNSGVLRPGTVQRMSAGTGVRHAERSVGPRDTHYLQMWLACDQPGTPPSYAQADVTTRLADGSLTPIVSGDSDVEAPIRLAQSAATLYAARLPGAASLRLPAGRWAHLFVARGRVELPAVPSPGGALSAGDAVRITDGAVDAVTGSEPAEILLWVMNTTLG
jgi:redox-sensitive bicupin YhaK (pirin superfamily)